MVEGVAPKKRKVKRKIGRPAHKPTAATRKKVEILRADGWSWERIARNIGIEKPTLAKHYMQELKYGDDNVRAALLGRIYEKAMEGNVSAARAFEKMTSSSIAPPDPNRAGEPVAVPVEKPVEVLGKKEQARIEAVTAAQGTSWQDLVKH